MKKNDDLFDKEIREQLKKENRYIPDKINKIFDESIENERNKSNFKFKKVSGICAAVIAGTIIFGIIVPTYASEIPIIGNLFEVFKLNRYENYDKYASDLNISKESSGVNITINKIIYDGIDLDVFYTIESETTMENIPRFLSTEIKVNGEVVSFSNGETGEFLDDNKVYVGAISYSVNDLSVPKEIQEENNYEGYIEMPDEFLFSLKINKIGDIEENNIVNGSWSFDIPVSNEKLKGEVKESDINIDLGDIYEGAILSKIIKTPINTSIQGIAKDKNRMISGFMVFDDKGRYIQGKSGQGMGHEENGEYKYYFGYNFKEVYEDTESLIFVPYDNEILVREWKNSKKSETYENNGMSYRTPKLNELLNLQGETKLNSQDGNEYSTIAKVEVLEGKTKVYFKSDYGIYAIPIEIIDDTGKSILPTGNSEMVESIKNLKYIYETEEFMVEFDGEVTGDKCTISYYDESKSMRIYNDKAFTVNIPK